MAPFVPQPFVRSQTDIDQMRRLTRRLDRTLLVFAAVALFVATWAGYLCLTLSSEAVR